jgi:hypothetical protein
MPVPLDPTTEAGVFEAARQVLAAPTVPAFTLEAVAERAGMDPERLRRRWPDAALLLAEAVGRAAAIEDVPDLGDTRAELSIALQRLFDADYGNTFAERALASGIGFDSDRSRLRELAEKSWRSKVEAVLHRAIGRGDLPPDAHAELIVDVCAGAIAYQRAFRAGTLNHAFVDVLLDMALPGMASLRPPQPAEALPQQVAEALLWLDQIPAGRMLRIGDGVPVRLLAEAPDHRAVIDKHAVVVSAGVARDFMPFIAETHDFASLIADNSTRLFAVVSVAADGPDTLPPLLRADRIVVLHGDEAWVAPLAEERLSVRNSREFSVTARLGPKWEPGTLVDIVVRLVTESGAARLVRVPQQPIDHVA